MGRIDNPGIWDKIQKNVQETEQLVGQKKYNLSMIKARQTMEYLVSLQCDKAGMVEGPTDTIVRDLYRGQWITKSTAEHYLQILALGNRADSEGDNSASSAEMALRFLKEEVRVYSGDAPSARVRTASVSGAAAAQRTTSSQRTSSQRTSSQGSSARRSSTRQTTSARSCSSARQAASSVRTGKSSGARKRKSSSGLQPADLLKLLVPLVLIIILIFLIRALTAKPSPTIESTPAPTTTPAITTEAPTTAPQPETTAPAETEPVVYKTTTTLNVRSGPSTSSSRIGKLDPNVVVDYAEDYDDGWAVIMYNNQQAYVSKEYLTVAGE